MMFYCIYIYSAPHYYFLFLAFLFCSLRFCRRLVAELSSLSVSSLSDPEERPPRIFFFFFTFFLFLLFLRLLFLLSSSELLPSESSDSDHSIVLRRNFCGFAKGCAISASSSSASASLSSLYSSSDYGSWQ